MSLNPKEDGNSRARSTHAVLLWEGKPLLLSLSLSVTRALPNTIHCQDPQKV